MGLFTWFNGEVPSTLQIKQAYGVAFTADGRIMLRVENNFGKPYYSLAGGTPEKEDKDIIETLRREFKEEVNTTIKEIHLAGYQRVDENNGMPHYAQVRFVCLIDKIGKKQPDPDKPHMTYDRFLTTPEKAISLLNWGDSGEQMIRECMRLAKIHYSIYNYNDLDESV